MKTIAAVAQDTDGDDALERSAHFWRSSCSGLPEGVYFSYQKSKFGEILRALKFLKSWYVL
jgi:hypothetical protein